MPCTQKISELSWKPKGLSQVAYHSQRFSQLLKVSSCLDHRTLCMMKTHLMSTRMFSLMESQYWASATVYRCAIATQPPTDTHLAQEMASYFGGKVGGSTHREYGHADVEVIKLGPPNDLADKLFDGLEGGLQVWMSHGDKISEAPKDFSVIGKTNSAPFAAIAHSSKPFFGIQFHPEVTHTSKGKDIIGRFVLNICQCSATWTMVSFY